MECDVNMPELYGFVHDRLHLLPTQQSIQRQSIKITLRPATSAQRNFTFSYGGRYLNSTELEQIEVYTAQQARKHQSQAKQSIFDYLWQTNDGQQQQQQQQQQASAQQ